MAVFADCDCCGVVAPCESVDGHLLCDECFDEYMADLNEDDPDYYCDGDCDVCDVDICCCYDEAVKG